MIHSGRAAVALRLLRLVLSSTRASSTVLRGGSCVHWLRLLLFFSRISLRALFNSLLPPLKLRACSSWPLFALFAWHAERPNEQVIHNKLTVDE